MNIKELEQRVSAALAQENKTLRRTTDTDPEEFGLHVLESQGWITPVVIEDLALRLGITDSVDEWR